MQLEVRPAHLWRRRRRRHGLEALSPPPAPRLCHRAAGPALPTPSALCSHEEPLPGGSARMTPGGSVPWCRAHTVTTAPLRATTTPAKGSLPSRNPRSAAGPNRQSSYRAGPPGPTL